MPLEVWGCVTAMTVPNCWHHLGILSPPNDSAYLANSSPTSPITITAPIIQPTGVSSAFQDHEAALSQLTMTAVLPKNIINAKELLSIEGEKVTEEEWMDKDITEQTRIDIIKAEGGVVDDLDELGKADSFLFLLPTAC